MFDPVCSATPQTPEISRGLFYSVFWYKNKSPHTRYNSSSRHNIEPRWKDITLASGYFVVCFDMPTNIRVMNLTWRHVNEHRPIREQHFEHVGWFYYALFYFAAVSTLLLISHVVFSVLIQSIMISSQILSELTFTFTCYSTTSYLQTTAIFIFHFQYYYNSTSYLWRRYTRGGGAGPKWSDPHDN